VQRRELIRVSNGNPDRVSGYVWAGGMIDDNVAVCVREARTR
jgi:hypothetical protein